ncbi:AraC family transcriptional regulator [Endozoicomonas sp. OPT23]|nr:AraC family transcriptional regulator [Endozoicomonas sp. OPT23]
MLTTSISLPLEMIQAGMTYSRLNGTRNTVETKLCSETLGTVKATGGISLCPELTFEDSGTADLVVVPGLWRNPLPVAKKSPAFIQWLKNQYEQGATFCVIGTGVTFMAEAGLLEGQPAATHWYFLDRLKQEYPNVDFKPHHLITRSDRIFCAGSVNSGADLMVHLIGLAMGERVAHKVEQQFSHEIRRPLEQILYTSEQASVHRDETIIQLQEWLQQSYQEDVSLTRMIEITGLTQRTLSRRFREATAMTPIGYVQKLRLNMATELLRTTDLTIREISTQIGYTDPIHFSRLFQKHFHLSPSDFKRSVRGKLFYLNQ